MMSQQDWSFNILSRLEEKGKEMSNLQTILHKLAKEGTLDKLAKVLKEVFQNEKNFAVSELRKIQ
jgi:hypothetical protein